MHEQCAAYHHNFHIILPYDMLVLSATFNNISVLSVLLAEETGVSGVNFRPVASHRQTLSHNVVSSTPHNVSGDSTDCG